jgi:tetratricopeptide (TPR) repeat protein
MIIFRAFRASFFLFCVSIISVLPASILDDANSYYAAGKIPEALQLYKKAILQGENPTLCYFNCGNAYYRMDSIAQAIVYYKASLTDAPEFFKGRLNLAIACYALDELAECITYATQALTLSPDNQKALLTLAAAYRKARAYPEAIVAFERLAVRFPEMEEPIIALGEMYRDLDDPEEAIRWLEQYPHNGKNYAASLFSLAEISESANDLPRARYYLRKSFDKDTTKQWAYYRFVALDERAGKTLLAFEEAETGVARFPRFAELALLAAAMALKLEKFDKARRYFEIARDNGSAHAVIGLDKVRYRLHEQ